MAGKTQPHSISINIIDKIIKKFNENDEQLSLTISKAAISIALFKRDFILNPAVSPDLNPSKFQKAWNWIYAKIDDATEAIKNKIQKKIEVYENEQQKAAFADVVVLLAYLYENHASLNENEELECLLATIVTSGKLNDLLETSMGADTLSETDQKITIQNSFAPHANENSSTQAEVISSKDVKLTANNGETKSQKKTTACQCHIF